jgi:MFS family permease
MIRFIPVIISGAIIGSIYAALIIPVLESSMEDSPVKKADYNQQALLCMTFFGVGEILGGVLNGYLQDCLGTKRFALFNIIELLLAYGLLIWYNYKNAY